MAETRGMVVDIVVKLKVANREPKYRVSEERLENEAVSVVAECLSKEKTVTVQEASLLDYEHCKWVFETGMSLRCGLPKRVLLFPDGSWRYPDSVEPERSGRTFGSLVRFVQEHKGRKD